MDFRARIASNRFWRKWPFKPGKIHLKLPPSKQNLKFRLMRKLKILNAFATLCIGSEPAKSVNRSVQPLQSMNFNAAHIIVNACCIFAKMRSKLHSYDIFKDER